MTMIAGAREQSRARYPDQEGYVERDGVKLFYEVYGDGEETILLLPTWSIIHSRHWKAQIPYLSRHFRVVTFDGRGNGKSDRPRGVEAYIEAEFAADTTRGDGRDEHRQRDPGRALVRRPVGHDRRRRPSRARQGDRLHRPRRPARPGPPGATGQLRGRARHRRGLGEVQPPLLAARLQGLPRVLLRADVQRAALDQADRGLRELGARDRPGDARRHDRRAQPVRHPALRRHRRPRHVPRARDPRRPGPDPAVRPGRRAGEGDRRRAGDARGLRPRPAGARPDQGQPAAARVRRTRTARARAPGPAAAAAASARCSSPPPSGSATRAATSRSPRSCARCIPTSRSTGWRRTP